MASTIKVDNVQNTPGTNIISKCSTTITIGASSDTIALASGASQTGFGRTGTVDWDTSIHTGTVTAATGKGYFVNTTSGGITVNLPAAAVGSIVAVSDYASTAASNNITVEPNGSEKINGVNDGYTISTAGLAVTLVYADATRGWKSVTGSDADATGVLPAYVTATGGTPCSGAIVCTNYKVHTFTGPGTFCVSCGGNADGSNTVDYLVIAGGGGGGGDYGGGGGAGGYRFTNGTASGCYTAGPAPLGASALAVSTAPYAITVGAGGTGGTRDTAGTDGADSIFSSITSTAGGKGGTQTPVCAEHNGADGGSGGGAVYCATGGTGNTPPTNPSQGFAGGDGGPCATAHGAGAGGGASAVGAVGTTSVGGAGGAGLTSCITASPVARGGGGGGAGGGSGVGQGYTPGAGGTGGGGAGAPDSPSGVGVAGTVNTGGGGGGGNRDNPTSCGGIGGSGVVIIRYKFQ